MGYRDIPAVTNHRVAEYRYDGIKPLRGSNPPIRPLGKRTRKEVRISREERADGMVYHVEYVNPWGGFKITYYPDNTIDLSGEFKQQSEREIASVVLNKRVAQARGRLWINCMTPHPTHPNKLEPVQTWLELKHNLTGYKFMPDEIAPRRFHHPKPVYPQARVLNKERAKQARAPVQHFWKYCQGMLKLYGEDYVPAELGAKAFGSHSFIHNAPLTWQNVNAPHHMTSEHKLEFMTSGDHDKYNFMFLYLAYECKSTLHSAHYVISGSSYKMRYPVKSTLAAFRRRIEQAVYDANPSVFDVKTIMSGKIPARPA